MRVRLLLGVAVVVLCHAPPAGAATTFGLTDFSSPNNDYAGAACASTPCLLYSQDPVYAAPADGVIVRWRSDALCAATNESSSELRLRVFRRIGDSLTLMGSSQTVTAARCNGLSFPTQVPVRAGEEIGAEVRTPQFYLSVSKVAPGSVFRVEPLPADGTPADDGTQVRNEMRLLLNADLEPDVDRDGAGDETQDADDDNDGVSDADEAAAGSDPLDADSDDDGIADGAERSSGSNPRSADSDGDGVADGADQCITTAGVPPGGCPAADLPPTVAFTAPATGSVLPATPTRLTAAAADDRGVAAVEFIDDEVVVCRDTQAPYECDYAPDDGDVGQNLLVARAIDSGGQQAIALRSVRVARFVPAALTNDSTARPSGRRRTVSTSGALSLPLGVRRATGCLGRISVQVKSGRRTVSRRVVRLGPDCTYRSRVTLGRTRRLSVSVRFEGNAALSALRGPTRSLR